MSSRRSGLTLLEVVFAAAILSVLLLGVFTSLAHAMRSEALTREREAATRRALLELDDRTAAVITPANFDAAFVDTRLDEGFDVEVDAGDGTRVSLPLARRPNENGRVGQITATELPEGTYDGRAHLVELRAVVRWRGVDGRDAEVVMTTWKVRPLE